METTLETKLKNEARRMGFSLAGITTPDSPPHWQAYEKWLSLGRHASMHYLADVAAREKRASPRLILPECRSILVLGIQYSPPPVLASAAPPLPDTGRVAAYAWGQDYHLTLPPRLQALVSFLEEQTGQPVPHRWYTDTGPVLERDLAMRAGLGWIGKNTCLINPRLGSYFLLAEIFLGIELEPDPPFEHDRCGTCTRCIEACPTKCILPDRSIDAGRCISYLTIENKAEIPPDLQPDLGNWIFGCDICQMACPWNRRATPALADPAFAPRPGLPTPTLTNELQMTPQDFNTRFKDSPLKRAKRRGYLRNVAVALGNSGDPSMLPVLERACQHDEPLVSAHARQALGKVVKYSNLDRE